MLKRFFKTNRKSDDDTCYGRRPVRTPNCFKPGEDTNRRVRLDSGSEVTDQQIMACERFIEKQLSLDW